MQKGDLDEIQRTVNSNYGLFGIIVTDCKEADKECNNQKVIAKSQPERKGWGEKKFPENLFDNPYNVLKDPAPITAEWGFKDARGIKVIPTGNSSKGKIIGRVYYLRRDPPEFTQTQINWLLVPVESLQILFSTQDTEKAGNKLYEFFDSGANKYYSLTNLLGIVIGLSLWRTWERMVYKKNLQQKIYEQREKEAIIRIDRFDRYKKQSLLLQENLKKSEISLSNKKEDEERLQLELEKARGTVNEETQKLQYLQDKVAEAIKESELAKQENCLLTEQLKLATGQASEKWLAVSALQLELDSIKQSSIDIEELQEHLKQAIQEASNSQKNAEYLAKKLDESSKFLGNKENNYSELSIQFSETQEILKIKENNIKVLQEDLAEISFRENQQKELIESLKQEKERLESDKKQLEKARTEDRKQNKIKIDDFISQENKKLDDLCDSLGQEIEDLKSKLHKATIDKMSLKKEIEVLKDKLSQLEEIETDGDIYFNGEDDNIDFSSVFDALKAAEKTCSFLEIWDSAIESVYTLNHYLPNKVYRILLILNDVGEMYFEKRVGTDLDELFRNKGVMYSPRESSSTIGLYSGDRKFRHRGNSKQMYRHLKVGRRLRIYFEFDEQYKKVQIGYCGKHLQTSGG